MRKWVILGGIAALLLAAAAAVLLAGFDAWLGRNRAWLAGRFEAAAGRPVRFDAVGVSLRGGLSARLQNLRIGNDPAAGEGDLLTVREVRVAVRLLPALLGRYEVSSVTLDAPAVTIVRSARGTNVATPPAARPPGSSAAGGDAAAGAAAAAAVLVSRITIRDGTVRFIDRTAKPPADLGVHHIDADASDVGLDRPIRFSVAAALAGDERQTLSARGTIGPLGAPQPRLTASASASAAAVRYGAVLAKPPGTPLELEIDAAHGDARLDVARLDLRLADLTLATRGSIGTAGSAPAADLQIEGGTKSLAAVSRLVPALAGREITGALAVHVRAAGPVAAGQLPALDGTVTLDGVSVRGPDLPWRVSDLTATITLGGAGATLAPTTFKLADVPVRVEASIAPLADPTIRWAVTAARLPAAVFAAAGGKGDVLHDVEARGTVRPSSGEAQAAVRSARGRVHDLDFGDLDTAVTLRDRVVAIERATARACDGTLETTGRLDLRAAGRPRFDLRTTIRGMLLAPLLASQAPRAAGRIDGRLDTTLAVGGSGTSWERIRPTLEGNGRFDVRDGVLRDVNLAESVLGAAGVPGLATLVPARVRSRHAALFTTGDTRFDRLGATVRIGDGRATTDDLVIAARDFTLDGRGVMQLDGPLDATATLHASRELSADIVAEVKEARYLGDTAGRIQVPFRVTGTLPKVGVRPDAAFLARAVGRALIDKGLGSLGGKEKPGKKKRPEQQLLQKGLDAILGR